MMTMGLRNWFMNRLSALVRFVAAMVFGPSSARRLAASSDERPAEVLPRLASNSSSGSLQ